MKSEDPPLLGAVLAGGKSRRFGRDKADVEVGGRTMLERAVHALEGIAHDVVIVGSRQVPAPSGLTVVPDRRAGLGPLGGLHAALLEARERELSGVVLLACDLPLVAPDVVRVLVDAYRGRPVAPPRGDGVEPLCAVYPIEALPTVEARLDSDDRSLHGLFRALGGERVDAERWRDGSMPFLNVNTPHDHARAEALLSAREPS